MSEHFDPDLYLSYGCYRIIDTLRWFVRFISISEIKNPGLSPRSVSHELKRLQLHPFFGNYPVCLSGNFNDINIFLKTRSIDVF